jgi:hypothetical protein
MEGFQDLIDSFKSLILVYLSVKVGPHQRRVDSSSRVIFAAWLSKDCIGFGIGVLLFLQTFERRRLTGVFEPIANGLGNSSVCILESLCVLLTCAVKNSILRLVVALYYSSSVKSSNTFSAVSSPTAAPEESKTCRVVSSHQS